MEVDDDLQTLLAEQRRELTAAQAVESDLDLAYQLQMQEATSASLSDCGNAASSSNPTFDDASESGTSATQLLVDEISKYAQRVLDQQAAEAEMEKIRKDLNRQIHDQAFAREILNVPEEEWVRVGDHFEKPFTEGSAAPARGNGGVLINNQDCFRVYVKGLMGGEMTAGGIGVAICDMNDGLVFEVSKGVVGGEMSGDVVELKALIEGLHVATVLGLKRILIVSDSNFLYQCVTGKQRPRVGNVATLIDQVTLLQRNLAHCNTSLVGQKDVKFAVKFAQDGIVSLTRQPVENNSGKNMIETCAICLEDINTNLMFSIDGCLHRYCLSCMRRHSEVKLHQGVLPKCPHQECRSSLKKDDCKQFLTPELFNIMIELIMEASIPPTDRMYCPYPACSALMSRSEYASDGTTLACLSCKKCERWFCMTCKVPWHYNMTCTVYKQQNPHPCPEDAELKSLATRSRWRQCGICNNMVSLSEGCNHIYCRCGHEFCYICGAAWKNKKATCNCPIWDEQKIIYGDHNRPQQRRF